MMTLAELAFGCHIYAAMTDDDAGYRQLLLKTDSALDLKEEQHRKHLLVWLNNWGCRQFAKAYHGLAADEIRAWYDDFGSGLFPGRTNLLSLADAEFTTVEKAYDGLASRTASKKNESPVKFGPVGTAKILFALRPEALIAWDASIRNNLGAAIRDNSGLDDSGLSYCKYLGVAQSWLKALSNDCEKKRFALADLPKKVGRPNSSVAKLVDEYLWVTVSRKCKAPDKKGFERWAEWSG